MSRAVGQYTRQPGASRLSGYVGVAWLAATVWIGFAVGPVEAVVLFAALCSGTVFGTHSMQDALRKRGYAVAHIVVGRDGVVPTIGQTDITGEHVRWIPPTFRLDGLELDAGAAAERLRQAEANVEAWLLRTKGGNP